MKKHTLKDTIKKIEEVEKWHLQKEATELPDPTFEYIMRMNNLGELTVHMNSALSYRICSLFGVKHEMNIFIKK